MKLKFKRKLIPILFLLFVSSCGHVIRSSIKEDGKQIPINFGIEDITILVVRKDSNYNKLLEQRFSENYLGSYVIINENELDNVMYKDVKKYRYVFDKTEATIISRSNNKITRNTYLSFCLQDRSTGKVYKTANIYTTTTALMEEYLISLEKVRRKNNKLKNELY